VKRDNRECDAGTTRRSAGCTTQAA
jgi:hypothetical protein